jgi:hypothetical protein
MALHRSPPGSYLTPPERCRRSKVEDVDNRSREAEMSAFDERARRLGRTLAGRMGAAWTRTKGMVARMTSSLPGRHA